MPPNDDVDDDDIVFQTEEELREGKVVYAFLKAASGESLTTTFFSINIAAPSPSFSWKTQTHSSVIPRKRRTQLNV